MTTVNALRITDVPMAVDGSVRRRGRDLRVRARRGVLLAAGGYAHNGALREKYGQVPNEGRWTSANPGETGEVFEAVRALGAATDFLDDAWWVPTILGPGEQRHMIIPERSRPHSIMVDAAGRRYFNEAVSYMEAGRQMYRRERETGGGIPSWLVIDAQHRSKYMLGPILPGWTPKEWLDSGHLERSDTLAGLAAQCGMDPSALTESVDRFNRFARTGVDEDFGRGEGAHERYQGDPRHRPNPCLGPVEKPPFYAIRVYPGDVGTCGGLLCNEHSQVLDEAGTLIPGLYAAGNITASVMGRTYPGAGASIAASSVFSFIAATHAAREQEPPVAGAVVEIPDIRSQASGAVSNIAVPQPAAREEVQQA